MFRLTPVLRILIIINIVVFGVKYLMPFNLNGFLGLYYLDSSYFRPFQFITYMFAHADFWHLFFNMFGLVIFGPLIEQVWGSQRFFIFYLVCGIGAGVLYSGIHYQQIKKYEIATQNYIDNPSPEDLVLYLKTNNEWAYQHSTDLIYKYDENPNNPQIRQSSIELALAYFKQAANTPMVGASGSLFGVLMAFGLLFPNMQLMLLFPPIPVKAKYVVGFYAISALFGAVQNVPGDNVAHYAHLGGMVFGFIMFRMWKHGK